MLRASLQQVRARAESLFAIANTAAGSLFWLALAFTMSPYDYGRMMALQASVLLVGLLLSFRTHDLVFYLMNSLRFSLERGFRIAAWIEWLTTIIGVAFIISSLSIYFYISGEKVSTLGLVGFSVLSTIGSNQGAAIAKLRYSHLDRTILRADTICVACWLAALATVPLAQSLSSAVILMVGAAPTAVRAAWLTAMALMAPAGDAPRPRFVPPRQNVPVIVKYLLSGQATNFVKNGAVSLETLILAAFVNPRIVGLYRIARGALGVSTAALNVLYQKAFPKLARSPSPEDARQIARQLGRNSVLLQLSIFPLAAVVVFAYGATRPDATTPELLLLLVGILVTQIPVALQQSSFAVLSLAGRHHTVSLGFLFSFGVLAAVAGLMFVWPSLLTFLLGLTLANLVRFGWLRAKSAEVTNNASSTVEVGRNGP
jgi:hypothetical protein